MQATVLFKKTTDAGGYLFARVGRDKVLCHQDACDFAINDVHKGAVLEVGRVESTLRGLKGFDVRWVRSQAERPIEAFSGEVASINFGGLFVFVTSPSWEQDVFVHATDFKDYADGVSATFDTLERGDWLRGYFRHTSRGPRGHEMERDSDSRSD